MRATVDFPAPGGPVTTKSDAMRRFLLTAPRFATKRQDCASAREERRVVTQPHNARDVAVHKLFTMRILASLGNLRTTLAILAVITAVQITLVSVGNITDFGTNREFVLHVFAMDTTFRSPNMMWRAVTNAGVAVGAYILVITWESLTAIVLIAASIAWTRALIGCRRSDVARRLSTCGWTMEIILFGGGFIAVGGEWFQMWQSSMWDGLQPALQNFLIASVGIVLAHLPSLEPPSRS